MSTITIGVDLAKSTFSVCVVDGAGKVLRRLDRPMLGFPRTESGVSPTYRMLRSQPDCAICASLRSATDAIG